MGKRARSTKSSAVVTGAGSGIGRAFAVELAARGGRVVCADVHAPPPDLLVNNAGVGVGGLTIGALPIADWRWAVSVNLWGAIHGCHVVVPVLRDGGRGGIVNVCSAASFAAAPRMAAYNATKAGMLALSETLCAELHGTDIAVTATFPSWVQTKIADRGRLHGHTEGLARRLAARGCSPDHVAQDALDALDAGRLYTFPQREARALFRVKGLFPSGIRAMNALVARAGLLDAGAAAPEPRTRRTP